MANVTEQHTFHQTKHVMYKKDGDEWVHALKAKNLKQLIDLYDKIDDLDLGTVRIQQIRTTTTISIEQFITIDMNDDLQVEAAIDNDNKRRQQNDANRKLRQQQ